MKLCGPSAPPSSAAFLSGGVVGGEKTHTRLQYFVAQPSRRMSVGLHCGMAPAYQRLVSFGLGGGQPKGRQIDLSLLAYLVILTASSSLKLLLYRFWGSPPLATHRMPLLTPAVLRFSAAALRERTDFYRVFWARLALDSFFL